MNYIQYFRWDDLKLRISKIGEVVESVAEREENLIAGDEIDEELSKNNVKIITSFVDIEDKKSDAEDFKDKKSMVKGIYIVCLLLA
jgi:cell division GTPase FtsZ